MSRTIFQNCVWFFLGFRNLLIEIMQQFFTIPIFAIQRISTGFKRKGQKSGLQKLFRSCLRIWLENLVFKLFLVGFPLKQFGQIDFWQQYKTKFGFKKIDLFCQQLKTLDKNRIFSKIESLVKNRHFGKKNDILVNIVILVKNRNFSQKYKILVKNRNCGQTSKFS